MNKIIIILVVHALLMFSQSSWAQKIQRKNLLVYTGEEEAPLLRTQIGKQIVENLIVANGKTISTTSCRLENKRVVPSADFDRVMKVLKEKGYELDVREVKNLPAGSKAGTFTLYGAAIKFVEAPNLPKTSIKMRVRMYIFEYDGVTKRSEGTDKTAFLEIKIKNPIPGFPLSVHKYRLVLPDRDILQLIRANPDEQESFSKLLAELAHKAHKRDSDKKNQNLIDAIFDAIKILAIANPDFIKPTIGIMYHRVSKKFDEEYEAETDQQPIGTKLGAIKKRLKKKPAKTKATRSYEITIDENLRAYRSDFSRDKHRISLDKYFAKNGMNKYLIASYPPNVNVVEFKQPHPIGYDIGEDGVSKIRTIDKMHGAQKDLYQAFVEDLGKLAVVGSKPDSGKFFHVKQFMRIAEGKGREGEVSILKGR